MWKTGWWLPQTWGRSSWCLIVLRHWESLVAERDGGDSINDEGDTAQMVGRKIRERDDRRWQVEEGHARMMVKAALFYVENRLVASTDMG